MIRPDSPIVSTSELAAENAVDAADEPGQVGGTDIGPTLEAKAAVAIGGAPPNWANPPENAANPPMPAAPATPSAAASPLFHANDPNIDRAIRVKPPLS